MEYLEPTIKAASKAIMLSLVTRMRLCQHCMPSALTLELPGLPTTSMLIGLRMEVDVLNIDDGEWGAGRELLQLLRQHAITNTLVCVTRWYGETHLGRDRLTYIKEAAMSTLHLQEEDAPHS